MVVSVQAPFPIFCDATGAPIDAGYVYCGTENLNPITPANRISIFSDAALTIALDNPVRTSGGYPVDASGNPCNIYAAGQFSIAIADRNNVVRVTSPSYGFRVLSGAITFDTVVIGTSIVPDAAGGASSGSASLPWSTTTTRDLQAKTATVYDTAQPAVAADLAGLNQRKSIVLMARIDCFAAPAITDLYNAGGTLTRTGVGVFTLVPTVSIPAGSIASATISTNDPTATVVVSTTASLITIRVYLAGVAADGSVVDLIIFGNPAVADPIA